mmetsp:Transcript_9832/g.37057  ORF Transcript_9832/g.37057 Transcript_9832/m.37057 type:complete len:229 (+) Transcript_9832:4762-5448(+)
MRRSMNWRCRVPFPPWIGYQPSTKTSVDRRETSTTTAPSGSSPDVASSSKIANLTVRPVCAIVSPTTQWNFGLSVCHTTGVVERYRPQEIRTYGSEEKVQSAAARPLACTTLQYRKNGIVVRKPCWDRRFARLTISPVSVLATSMEPDEPGKSRRMKTSCCPAASFCPAKWIMGAPLAAMSWRIPREMTSPSSMSRWASSTGTWDSPMISSRRGADTKARANSASCLL